MQGAQLKAQNDARTQATIGNFFDKLAASKQKQLDAEKAKATDYEGSAMRVLQAKAQGVEPDPQDLVRAKAYGEFQSMQNAIDPVTGNVYSKNRNIFEAMGTAPSNATYTPQFPAVQPTGINPSAMPPQMPQRGVVDDIGVLPVGDSYAEVSGMFMPQRDAARGVVAPTFEDNRKLDQAAKEAAMKSNLSLQEQAIKDKMAIENEKNKPIGLEQGKIATFADRMIDANSIINDKIIQAEQLNLKNRVAGDVPIAGNYMVSKNYQKASQAERNFINSVLRRESGAVISPEEFSNAKQQYFPQPGDGADVLEQKKQNRQTVIDGFIREAGPSYKSKNNDVQSLIDKYAK